MEKQNVPLRSLSRDHSRPGALAQCLRLPAFSLSDLEGGPRAFPGGKPTLLCFVREECETCHLSIPVIEAVHRAYGERLTSGRSVRKTTRSCATDIGYRAFLDDTALKVSFNYR